MTEMKKFKLSTIQADKVSQILIEENRLKNEYKKVVDRKNDMVEMILDAQGQTAEQMAAVGSYNFTGDEEGGMYLEIAPVSTEVTTPTAKAPMQAKRGRKPKKK
jgi:hypothetical protein